MVNIQTLSKFFIRESTPLIICGLKQGKEISYYDNGKISEICNYANDKLHGDYFRYSTLGKQMYHQLYDDGVMITSIDCKTSRYLSVRYVYSNIDKRYIRVFI